MCGAVLPYLHCSAGRASAVHPGTVCQRSAGAGRAIGRCAAQGLAQYARPPGAPRRRRAATAQDERGGTQFPSRTSARRRPWRLSRRCSAAQATALTSTGGTRQRRNAGRVMDPPRDGLLQRDGLFKGMKNLKTIIYISCDVETFARDIKDFTIRGWRLTELQALDQFPQTSHVEILSVFTR